MSGYYTRVDPYVDDEGMYIPVKEYVQQGSDSLYRCIMTKEMFVEAYNKWIIGAQNKNVYDTCGQDDADDWSE